MRKYFKDPRYRDERSNLIKLFAIGILSLGAITLVLLWSTNAPPASRAPVQSGETANATVAPAPDPAEATASVIREAVRSYQSGNWTAVRELLSGVDLDAAGSPDAWELAGLLAEKDGDREAAIAAYSKGIAVSGTKTLLYRRSVARRGTGDSEGALLDIEGAANADPGDLVISNERFLLLVGMGRKDQVSREIQALNDGGTSPGMWVFGLAGLALENGEYSQARELLELADQSLDRRVFDHMIDNPVISRHRSQPDILPLFLGNAGRTD